MMERERGEGRFVLGWTQEFVLLVVEKMKEKGEEERERQAHFSHLHLGPRRRGLFPFHLKEKMPQSEDPRTSLRFLTSILTFFSHLRKKERKEDYKH